MHSDKQPPYLPVLLATTLSYGLVGWLSLWLAIAPTYAAPLYPAAGIALACVLTYGRRVLPGVAVGALIVNLLLNADRGITSLAPGAAFWLPVVIATGATLQAGVGAALVRRFVSAPLTLSEPRDVARFFVVGALLGCVVSASVATVALMLAGALQPGGAGVNWSIWWAGDALGVLIGAPVALTFIGRPRVEWAHRRLTVGVSLVIVTALLATAAAQVSRWDEQRTRVIFDRDATRSADALAAELSSPMHALEAMRSAAGVNRADTFNHDVLHRASAYWLAQPLHLKAIGWSQRVMRNDIADFAADVRRNGGPPGYHVFDRGDAQGVPAAAQDPAVYAVRDIEPMQGNAVALGLNSLSTQATRAAVQNTVASGRPVASAGFSLLNEQGDQAGIVIYQALYDGEPATRAQRIERATGVLFVTLRMDEAVRSVSAALPSYLQWCLVDTQPQGGRARLAGARGCEQAAVDGFSQVRPLAYAGRQWELRLSSPIAAVPDSRHWNAWLFSMVGLMATAMLGALLLSVTGRTRRIEVAVADRTADLQREVGERARTEAALRESEQRFRNILDHVPIGVIYTDLSGRIREANPKLRDMVGFDAAELAGMTSMDLTHVEDRGADLELSARLVRGEIATFGRKKRLVARDGRIVWVQAGTSLLRDQQGRPDRLVGVVEDITERLKLESAEHARESAEAASRAKSDFVSRMSHELRTPLNAMLGFAQLLELDRQKPLAPHQVEWTSQIQQAGWHLLHMINDTLDLSRIESGTVKLNLRSVPVADMIDATRALVEQSAERRRVRIDAAIAPDILPMLADETRVKQILTNLLSNAVKYNLEGGQVGLDARMDGARTVQIEVRDSGLGMTPEQMAELFQPFNRLGRDTYGEGTGIGLVISRRLAELMGGTLAATSTAGVGSRFVLRLPAAAVATPRALAADVAPAGVPTLPDYRQRLVHYIEDNETNAEVMRGIVAQRPQVKLEVSPVGLDGLAAIRRTLPSLVLLDMHLPDVDGLELLRHLKNDAGTADIPVVVVSADATSARIDESMALGAAHYVTKPVNVADMLALLDDMLEPRETRYGMDF